MEKQIGIIGLGKMGSGLVENFLKNGWEVVGYNRSPEKTDALVKEGMVAAYSIEELVESLSTNKKIWIMLPAGNAVDEVIQVLKPLLSSSDIIIDGGNGFYKDAIKRSALLHESGIHFMDVGVSGGPEGARNGACMMIGGSQEDFDSLKELFQDVCVKDGFAFSKGYGAGHFLKMIHNGIEYGMMQAIAEGFDLLNHCGEDNQECSYSYNMKEVARIYNTGSVIEGRLMNWLHQAMEDWGENLEPVSGKANQLGEGRWTAEVAEKMGVSHQVLNDALLAREISQTQPNYAGKIIQAMRGKFGNHPVLKNQEVTQTGEKSQ